MRKTIAWLIVLVLLPSTAANKAYTQESEVAPSPAGTGHWDSCSCCDPCFLLDECDRGWLRRFFSGEWYVSVGASREWWGNTNVRVNQPAFNNNFTVYNLRGIDDPSWDSLFGMQYNIRIGRFIDEARTLAIELNFDHTKFTSVLGQNARIAGTVNGQAVDRNFALDSQTFRYNLHNGVNHFMVNLVKRVPLIGETNETFSLAAIGKIGVGAVIPHADNTIFGRDVDVGPRTFNNTIGFNRGWWQINGFTAGIEGGFRFVFCKPFYIELTDKVAFADFYNVPVADGTARHNLWVNELILSVGVTLGARNVR